MASTYYANDSDLEEAEAFLFWTVPLENSTEGHGLPSNVTVKGSEKEYLFFKTAYRLIEEKYHKTGISQNFEESARMAFLNRGRLNWTSCHSKPGRLCSYFCAIKEVTYLLRKINIHCEDDMRKLADVGWYAQYVVDERRAFGGLDYNHHHTLKLWQSTCHKLQHFRDWMA